MGQAFLESWDLSMSKMCNGLCFGEDSIDMRGDKHTENKKNR